MYEVVLSFRASKMLAGYSQAMVKRIKDKLLLLGNNPVPHDAKYVGRVDGNRTFRIRIGTHHAIYTIIDSQDMMLVTKIDKRSRIYNN